MNSCGGRFRPASLPLCGITAELHMNKQPKHMMLLVTVVADNFPALASAVFDYTQITEGTNILDLTDQLRPVAAAAKRAVKRVPSPHVAWNVYLDGKRIDTVFYSASVMVTTAEIKRTLIEHDGYDSRITVRRRRLTQ